MNMKGMDMDVDYFFSDDSHFKLVTSRTEGPVIINEYEWRGEGPSLSNVYRDFYRAYGLVAESEQFIRVEIEPEAIVFHVVVGNTDDHAHGHFLQFRLVGERIVEVIREFNQIGEENLRSLEENR
jgi:hypothetical protein